MFLGINDAREAVGVSSIDYNSGYSGIFYYSDGVFTDLPVTDGNGNGFGVVQAINNAGVMVGQSSYRGSRGFIATASPEPGTFATAGAVVIALLLLYRRREIHSAGIEEDKQ